MRRDAGPVSSTGGGSRAARIAAALTLSALVIHAAWVHFRLSPLSRDGLERSASDPGSLADLQKRLEALERRLHLEERTRVPPEPDAVLEEPPRGGPPVASRRPASLEALRNEISSLVSMLRVTLDTSAVPGWQEIDTVGLLTPDGLKWPVHAAASSVYGQ